MPTTLKNDQLSQERLREVVSYDLETGDFTWLISRPGVVAGQIAGTIRVNEGKSYRIISIDGKKHRAHRLAFLYVTGTFPCQLVDHQDGNGLNNSWLNLRRVDSVGNNRNMRLRADNTSGICGVHWSNKDRRWVVQIKTEKGDRGYVGQFPTLLDAVAARLRSQRDHDFHRNHGQDRPL